jgi:hypothetical protein
VKSTILHTVLFQIDMKGYDRTVHLEKRTIIGAIKAIALEQPLMGTRREIQISSFTR